MILMVAALPAKADWFCESESGKRDDNVIWSCGMGDGIDEGTARKNALQAAIQEFDMICSLSSDCQGFRRSVEPKRTSCKQAASGVYTCTRLIVITLEKKG
jgi:hypothetical protein